MHQNLRLLCLEEEEGALAMRHCALCARIASGDVGEEEKEEERMEQSNKVRERERERESREK